MRTTLLLGMAVALAACGQTQPMGPALAGVPGSYQLETFDGSALPLTVIDLGAYQVELISDVLTLRDDNTWTQDVVYRIHDSGTVRDDEDHDGGNWAYRDMVLTLESARDASWAGTLSGSTLTLQGGGRTLVLRK